MENLKFVFDFVLKLFQTKLTFAPFTFSIFEITLAFIAIDIAILFVRKVFSDD